MCIYLSGPSVIQPWHCILNGGSISISKPNHPILRTSILNPHGTWHNVCRNAGPNRHIRISVSYYHESHDASDHERTHARNKFWAGVWRYGVLYRSSTYPINWSIDMAYKLLAALPRSRLAAIQRKIAPLLQFDVVGVSGIPFSFFQDWAYLPAQVPSSRSFNPNILAPPISDSFDMCACKSSMAGSSERPNDLEEVMRRSWMDVAATCSHTRLWTLLSAT